LVEHRLIGLKCFGLSLCIVLLLPHYSVAYMVADFFPLGFSFVTSPVSLVSLNLFDTH
jgi:hypothetical protein